MSARHKSVSSLDDRVARMSDLRVLVDTVSTMIAALDARVTELQADYDPTVAIVDAAQRAQSIPTDAEGEE